ncbi:MAG: hypothetical protein HZA20_10925 [Nitrospirae bacterium]|nr:hypothetical protein [Nitrospirota bacterium]
MQKRGGKEGYDAQGKNKVAVPPLSDEFPGLESMTIRMVYYQKGDNPVLMTRTLHVYPESDPAFLFTPCLIHDCEGGSFELAPIVYELLRNGGSSVSGQLSCVGSTNKDIPPDHASMDYAVEVVYKSMTKPEPPVETKPALRKKIASGKEVIPVAEPARKAVVQEPVTVIKPVEPVKKIVAKAPKKPVEHVKPVEDAKSIAPAKPAVASPKKALAVSAPAAKASAPQVKPAPPLPKKVAKAVSVPVEVAAPSVKKIKPSVEPVSNKGTKTAQASKPANKPANNAAPAVSKPAATKPVAAKSASGKPDVRKTLIQPTKAGKNSPVAIQQAPAKQTPSTTSKPRPVAGVKAVPVAAKPVAAKKAPVVATKAVLGKPAGKNKKK